MTAWRESEIARVLDTPLTSAHNLQDGNWSGAFPGGIRKGSGGTGADLEMV